MDKFKKVEFVVEGEIKHRGIDAEELTEDFFYHNARKFIEDAHIKIVTVTEGYYDDKGDEHIVSITHPEPLKIFDDVVKVSQLP